MTMIRLTHREKVLAVSSAVLVGVWAVFAVAVKPAITRMKTLGRIIPEKQSELAKVRAKSQEYISLRSSLDALRLKVASQEQGFELLPFLEALIVQCGLAEKAGMKPHTVPLAADYRETIVEIKLEKLALAQLVNFLWKVESSPALIKARTLHIKKNPTNPDLLDSTIEIHSAKLIQD